MFKDEGDISEGNNEIQAALKEFEAKSDDVPLNPNANLNVGVLEAPLPPTAPPTSGMVDFIMNHSGGLIKTEDQANYVLLFIFFLFMGLSVYFFWGTKSKTPTIPAQDFKNQIPLPN